MYSLKHFDIREFVPPTVYNVQGEASIELIDDRVLITADQLRDAYGPMVINNWHYWKKGHWSGALRKWSGLRVKGCPYGTAFSQHRFGRATDSLFRDYTADQVRADILAHPDLFPHINSVELGVSWLHFDVRNCDRIKTYTP